MIFFSLNCKFYFTFFIALLASRGRMHAPAGACKQSLYSSIFYSKKYALIPYLDNIEITLMKILNESEYFRGLKALFFLNRNYSFNLNNLISLNVLYSVKILVAKELQEKFGVSLVNLRKVFK